jgi:Holliday junction resolvase
MTFARRVDGTHAEVMQALRACGWLVADTSRLRGFVDLVAQKPGRTLLIEVKTATGKPTEAQRRLVQGGWWIVTVRSAEQAAQL